MQSNYVMRHHVQYVPGSQSLSQLAAPPQVANAGLIGIVIAQSPEFVAPYGAKKAVFGTNPIAISVPAENGPVTMDMATSAYAWFGVLEAKTAGRPLPHGVAQNAEGEITEVPDEVLQGGAIRVFDGCAAQPRLRSHRCQCSGGARNCVEFLWLVAEEAALPLALSIRLPSTRLKYHAHACSATLVAFSCRPCIDPTVLHV